MSSTHLTVPISAVDPRPEGDSVQSLADILRYVDACHRRCRGALGTAVVAAYEAGRTLNAYREQFKHGEWEKAVDQFVQQEGLAITLRTCQRYMKVASILSESLKKELGDERLRDPKTTRASLLRFLRQGELLSINKVLEFKKSPARKKGKKRTVNVAGSDSPSTTDAHFLTPEFIHSAVTEFFGRIDLDPCGSTAPGCQLPAALTVAPPNDGLAADQRWSGNVFVHPPLDQLVPFVARTMAAVAAGEADQAIVLVPAVMDADHASLLYPYIRGFLRDRPTFMTPSGEGVRPPTAYMLVYVSRNDRRLREFAEIFGHLADVYYPQKF